MTLAAVLIFCLTYLLIASRRLRFLPIGRPAGAVLGATLMVASGVLSPTESYQAVDHNTILLLFAMMLLTAYLERAGFFQATSRLMLALCRTPRQLLLLVPLQAGLLSALLVNDAVCVFMTPVLIVLCRDACLPLAPFLLALATSSNIGSAATLVGNPQNMIIGSMSKLPFRDFLLRSGPAALLGLGINAILLQLYYARLLPARLPDLAPATPVDHRRLLLPALVTSGVVVGFFAGAHLGYMSLVGVLVLVVAERADPRPMLARVDWSLLVFFCGLFVVVAGLAKTGIVEQTWARSAPALQLSSGRGLAFFSTLMTAGSNLISNVPMVLVTGPHLDGLGGGAAAWVLLAFTTTIAGNLTLVGSVANLIVAEGAREHYTIGFWEYARFGVVTTLLVLAAGVATIHLQAGLIRY